MNFRQPSTKLICTDIKLQRCKTVHVILVSFYDLTALRSLKLFSLIFTAILHQYCSKREKTKQLAKIVTVPKHFAKIAHTMPI